jgi:nitrite reductase/ring-hydroxylating ferredoxin subunit
MRRVPLCAVADVPDGGAIAAEVPRHGRPFELIVARRGERIVAYANVCPHAGSPLDWVPGRFMSHDGRHLQCATHGARFRLEDGLCVDGPCLGLSLTSLPVETAGEEVVVLLPES